MRQLGQVLLDQGLITNAQLDEAIEEQRERGRSLGRILVDRGFISERDLVTALAAQVGMEFVDLAEIEVDPRAVTMLAPSLSKRHALLPIRFEDGRLVVAMSDPSNVVAMDDVRTVTKMDIKVVIATRESVLAAVDRYASMADDIEAMADDLAGDDGAEDLAALTAVTEDAPIVKFVNLLISQAVADGASDIHIEPGEKELRVRYRIDGVLHEVMKSPKSIQSGVISRLKIMAEVDIAERRVPQDGRIGLNVHGKAIDLRFSTLPTVHGEKVVMRILDKTSVMMTLDDLGFLDHNERRYESAYRKPYGMILVTGPTGSGKALTLDTPVPTPAGMSTMGALNEGDEVFGRDGRPCRVVRVWPVNDHPELYRVHFSDGQQVVADRDHQWLVADHWGRNAPRTPKRRAAVAAYEQAHADADRLEELADTWDGAGSLRLAALTALVDTNVVGDHFPSAYAVRQALKAVDCPFTGGNGPVPQQFPTAVALKSLALRLRQRYSTQPVDQTPLYRMTTSEMVAAGFRTRAGQAQFAVPAPAALQLPPADLLVDPYLIGYWLGDGSTGGGRITVGDPYVNRDLASDLRDIGVIGVKHIPLAYSRGSYEQRLALLQGLMDSDGTVDDGDGGSCELTLSDRRLADDALALIRSLGIAASMVADAPASYRNDDGGKVEAGRRHRIHFTPHIEVFQLPRKRDRQTDRVARGPSEISRWRHVTDIEVVATDDPAYGPARCITVDSCDRTYLCGEGFVPTSNTTSLYATLNVLNQPGVNLITTEDPVEYQLPGISQVQVNNKVGLTFARALRSILRQDPDIILVGEMRDRETAQIGVEAALTGHLVLSTLHTNDAPSAVVRLTEMGIEPFLVGSAVDCVLAQRLARRVCSKCVEMYSPEAEILKAAGFDDETVEARPLVPRAVGCTSCSGTGYRGRLAIHEVMLVSEEIERMAVGHASSEDIGRVAVEQGMRPLREDGLAKVLLGRTTIEEVGRVVT